MNRRLLSLVLVVIILLTGTITALANPFKAGDAAGKKMANDEAIEDKLKKNEIKYSVTR